MSPIAFAVRLLAVVSLVLAITFGVGLGTASAGAAARAPRSDGVADALAGWRWPVSPARIVAGLVAPAHEYGPGHRGIDLAATVGTEVTSPADGVVAFAGTVADRGIVTIDHGGGLVTTLEPVRALVAIGTSVARGEAVATVDVGGHTTADAVHFGVREDGEYINPLLLLGVVPRAILLPCC